VEFVAAVTGHGSPDFIAEPDRYDRNPVLGSGTGQILTASADNNWTVIDMATDWSTVHPPNPA